MLFSIHIWIDNWHLVFVTWKLSLISLECSLQTTRKQTVIDVATYISDLSRVEMQSVILFYFFSKFENFYLDANFLKSRTLLRYHSTCPTVRIFYRFSPFKCFAVILLMCSITQTALNCTTKSRNILVRNNLFKHKICSEIYNYRWILNGVNFVRPWCYVVFKQHLK